MTNNDNRGSRIMNRSVTMLGLVAVLVATPVAGAFCAPGFVFIVSLFSMSKFPPLHLAHQSARPF